MPPLARAAGQDKGHRGKPRGLLFQGFAEGGGEFCEARVIEQAKQLSGEPGGGFAALEGGLKERLAFRNQSGQTTGSGRAQGLAFSLEQGLAVRGVFDLLVPVVGADRRPRAQPLLERKRKAGSTASGRAGRSGSGKPDVPSGRLPARRIRRPAHRSTASPAR